MFEKIKNKFKNGVFGFSVIRSSSLEQLKKENNENLVKRIEDSSRINELQRKFEESKLENLRIATELHSVGYSKDMMKMIDVFMEDPIPLDSIARRTYVGVVAGLHKDILEPKIKHMIAKCFLLLEESNNDRDFDQAVKGAIYFGREFLRWGNLMVSEQISNQQQGLSEEQSVITKVKSL